MMSPRSQVKSSQELLPGVHVPPHRPARGDALGSGFWGGAPPGAGKGKGACCFVPSLRSGSGEHGGGGAASGGASSLSPRASSTATAGPARDGSLRRRTADPRSTEPAAPGDTHGPGPGFDPGEEVIEMQPLGEAAKPAPAPGVAVAAEEKEEKEETAEMGGPVTGPVAYRPWSQRLRPRPRRRGPASRASSPGLRT